MRFEIRPLTSKDAAAFQVLRLRSLRESPEAFGSSYDEEVSRPLTAVGERLEAALTPHARVVFGALADGTLIGVVGCAQESRVKTRHKAVIWGMYVTAAHRATGTGAALLQALLDHVRATTEVRSVHLTVARSQRSAQNLYSRFGFRISEEKPTTPCGGNLPDDQDKMVLNLFENA